MSGLSLSQPKTIRSANLLHLQTTLTGHLNKGKHRLRNLLWALHPTPAVCGTPKESAMAFIKDNESVKKLSEDIDEMEKMLNDYLQFAKTQSQEDTVKINLKDLINKIKIKLNNSNLIVEPVYEEIFLIGRQNALERCFVNIIQNGLIYGTKVYLSLIKSSNRVVIIFEDNGPGIPQEQYRNIFKPFFRLDKSRSLNKSGVGLGLAIVEDIVNSHGGNINLSKSKHGGLQFKISLPF